MSFILRGYNNKEKTEEEIRGLIKNTDKRFIYNNKEIKKPTYEEISYFQEKTKLPFKLDLGCINVDIENYLSEPNENTAFKAKTIYDLLKECGSYGLTEGMLKNLYVRMIIGLYGEFKDLLDKKGNLIYIGSPDKYEFIILTMLKRLSINVYIIDLGGSDDSLVRNTFNIIRGDLSNCLNLSNKSMENKAAGIQDLNTEGKEPIEYLDFLLKDTGSSLELTGVLEDDISYMEMVNGFFNELKLRTENLCLIEGEVPNPTYEENESFDNTYKARGLNLKEVLSSYKFKESEIREVESLMEKITRDNDLISEGQVYNFSKVIYIWLIRYLDAVLKDSTEPALIIWGEVSKRDEDFFKIISLLNVKIIHFAPDKKDPFKFSMEGIGKIRIGGYSSKYPVFPYYAAEIKVETVAYRAERDLDTILYGQETLLYRPNQFKNIAPLTLVTTYDEIKILWDTEAKYRPHFSVENNQVKSGTLFTKVEGVPGGDKEGYIQDIRKLVDDDVILYDELPFTITNHSESWVNFVRNSIYKEGVDFESIKRSEFYKYKMLSLESQGLVIDKIKTLLDMDWCSRDIKNLEYRIVEALFTINDDVLRMVHSYDFTGKIPKVIIFSKEKEICSLEDCILIMFLKLIGFDILVIAPTGYQVIEGYVKKELFNTINIGPFDFTINNLYEDKNRSFLEKVKTNTLLSKFFK